MAISIRGVSKRFGGTVALDGVDLDVPSGSLTALLGPSGGGKSTLLRVVAGLEVADDGTVEVDGRDLTRVPVKDRGVGFCFQHYAPFRHMSVRKNVAFGLEVRKVPKADVRRRVDELLDLVKIAHVADRYPSQLSGGQRQRMALARALAIEPRVLLLDEPFGALDAQVRQQLRQWLRDLHEKIAVTTIFVTHDQEEAMEIADSLAIISEGRLQQVGPPLQLYDDPANEFVMGFLGPTTTLGGDRVRPHDLVVHKESDTVPSGWAAIVERVTHLGFEVRVDLSLLDGSPLWLQLSRGHAAELDLRPGERVLVGRADASPVRPVGFLVSGRSSPLAARSDGSGGRSPRSRVVGQVHPQQSAELDGARGRHV